MRRTFIMLLLIGCRTSPPARAPAPTAARPVAVAACAAVGEHLVRLAQADDAIAADARFSAGFRAEAARQCSEVPWSSARQQCLLRASSQDETLRCPYE